MYRFPALSDWLWQRLAKDATLIASIPSATAGEARVHEGEAPPEEAYPLVAYHLQAARNVSYVGGIIVMGTFLVAVKVVGRDHSLTALEPIANRVFTLLHKSAGPASDNHYVEGVLDSEIPFPPLREAGKLTRQLGGLYRFNVTKE